jgi:putative oxidoreductase
MSVSLSLLILRLIVGLFLAGHGAQKLFGWFGGPGFAGITGFLQSQGFKPAWLWALLGGLGEFGGGLLLALGLLSPLGAIAIFAGMLMVIAKFHWSKGFWVTQGGIEYPLLLLLLSIVLGLAGPGSYALDSLLGIALPTSIIFWAGVIASIIVDAIGLVTSRQPAPAQSQAHGTSAA